MLYRSRIFLITWIFVKFTSFCYSKIPKNKKKLLIDNKKRKGTAVGECERTLSLEWEINFSQRVFRPSKNLSAGICKKALDALPTAKIVKLLAWYLVRGLLCFNIIGLDGVTAECLARVIDVTAPNNAFGLTGYTPLLLFPAARHAPVR